MQTEKIIREMRRKGYQKKNTHTHRNIQRENNCFHSNEYHKQLQKKITSVNWTPLMINSLCLHLETVIKSSFERSFCFLASNSIDFGGWLIVHLGEAMKICFVRCFLIKMSWFARTLTTYRLRTITNLDDLSQLIAILS